MYVYRFGLTTNNSLTRSLHSPVHSLFRYFYASQVDEAAQLKSVLRYVTSHTGKDYWTAEEADDMLAFCIKYAEEKGVTVRDVSQCLRQLCEKGRDGLSAIYEFVSVRGQHSAATTVARSSQLSRLQRRGVLLNCTAGQPRDAPQPDPVLAVGDGAHPEGTPNHHAGRRPVPLHMRGRGRARRPGAGAYLNGCVKVMSRPGFGASLQ